MFQPANQLLQQAALALGEQSRIVACVEAIYHHHRVHHPSSENHHCSRPGALAGCACSDHPARGSREYCAHRKWPVLLVMPGWLALRQLG
jgi:hypothetical protein